MKKKLKISVVILTKDEEEMIKDCLQSVSFADEVIVIDSGSTDKTCKIAKKKEAKVYSHEFKDFADQRDFARKKAKGNWILYLDADERVTEKLKNEIASSIQHPASSIGAYRIPRLNIFFGKKMRYGGWYPDHQTRLFLKKNLLGWYGAVHESPKIKGKVGTLSNHLVHLSHRSLEACFEKSKLWTKMEAELFFKAGHPKVRLLHLIKPPIKEFVWRIFIKQGFRDGTVGWLEGLVQAFNKFLVYAQLWEKQQKKSSGQ